MDYYFDELCLADRAKKVKQLQARISFLEKENHFLKKKLESIKQKGNRNEA